MPLYLLEFVSLLECGDIQLLDLEMMFEVGMKTTIYVDEYHQYDIFYLDPWLEYGIVYLLHLMIGF